MATLSGIGSSDESDDDIGCLQLSGRTITPLGSPISQSSPRSQLNSSSGSTVGTNNAHGSSSHTQERTSNTNPEIAQILKIVQSLEKRMTTLEKRQAETDRRQEMGKKRQKAETTPASNYLKKQVRLGYNYGVEKGLTWNIAKGKRCTDDDNIAMTKHIETCVVGAITNPDKQQLTDAIEVHFRSRHEESIRNKQVHRTRQLHYSRKANKRDRRRKACVAKKSYSQEDREKYMAVLQTKYMSSEDEENGEMIVRHLKWESKEFKRVKKSLDKKYKAGASERSDKQMYQRKDGQDSERPQPKILAKDMWIVKTDV